MIQITTNATAHPDDITLEGSTEVRFEARSLADDGRPAVVRLTLPADAGVVFASTGQPEMEFDCVVGQAPTRVSGRVTLRWADPGRRTLTQLPVTITIRPKTPPLSRESTVVDVIVR